MQLMYACLISGLPLLLVEYLSRLRPVPSEISRKATHVLSALAVILAAAMFGYENFVLIGFLFVILLALSRKTHLWKSLYGVQRQTWGEIAFPAGIGVSAIISSSNSQFIIATLLLGLADTAGYVIGKKYGTNKVFKTEKTFEGFIAVLVTSIIILAIAGFEDVPFNEMLFIGLSVSVVELFTSKGLDNVTIPTTAALLIGYFS